MLEKFSKKNILYNEDSDIALAVSGGADSMFLLKMMCDLKLTFTVLIVDHKLREESTCEAEEVSRYIFENFNVKKIVILTWEHNIIDANIQSQAREARYNLLLCYCKENNIKYLYTAHNKNDQAETILMRIMRGSGIDGISGIKEVTTYKKYPTIIIRPMLDFYSEQIREFLNEEKIKYVEDKSNYNEYYDRVKVRKLIKKFPENIISRLCLVGKNADRSSNFIKKYTKKVVSEICTFSLGAIFIDIEKLMKEDEEIILRIIKKMIALCGNKLLPVRIHSLLKIYEKLKNSENFKITIGNCIIWTCNKHKTFLPSKILIIGKEKRFVSELCDGKIWDSRFEIDEISLKKHFSISIENEKIKILDKMWYKIKTINSEIFIIFDEKSFNDFSKLTMLPNLNIIMETNPCIFTNNIIIYPSIGIALNVDI